jgi:hypothetical protein
VTRKQTSADSVDETTHCQAMLPFLSKSDKAKLFAVLAVHGFMLNLV